MAKKLNEAGEKIAGFWRGVSARHRLIDETRDLFQAAVLELEGVRCISFFRDRTPDSPTLSDDLII